MVTLWGEAGDRLFVHPGRRLDVGKEELRMDKAQDLTMFDVKIGVANVH